METVPIEMSLDWKRKLIANYIDQNDWEKKQKEARDFYRFVHTMILSFIHASFVVGERRISMNQISWPLLEELVSIMAIEMHIHSREYRRALDRLKPLLFEHAGISMTSDYDAQLPALVMEAGL